MQSRLASKTITQSSNRALVKHASRNLKEERFCKCLDILLFIYGCSSYLSTKGKEKLHSMERMLIGCGNFTMVNQYCKWLMMLSIPPSLQKSSSIFLVGTDFRRRFAPSVFNPVGPLSQEGILHNPRQRFETVWSLSEQEKTTERTTHQSKRRSLTAKKMATKSLKTRYVSIAISLK